MRAGKVLHILYLWAVIFGGAIVLALLFPGIDLDFSVELAVLILIVMVAEWLAILFVRGQFSSSYAVIFGVLLLYGPAAAAWVGALGTMFGQGIANRGNPLRTTLFNSAQAALGVYGAYWIYRWTGGVLYAGEVLKLENVPLLLLFSGAYFIINHLLVYFYLLSRQRLSWGAWRDSLYWDASSYLFLVPLGFLIAVIYQSAGFTGSFLVLLLGLVVQLFMRRYLAIEWHNRELGLLYEVARRLNSSSDLDGLLHLILRESRRIVPYHTGIIYLWSQEQQLFVPAAVNSPLARELADMVWEKGEGIVGWAAATREPCLVMDAREDPRLQQEPGLSQFLRSLLVIPLISEDEVLGVFIIGDRAPDSYHEHNLHILTIVGGQAAVAMDNVLLHQRLGKSAGYDHLTRLPNRGQFVQRLHSELDRSGHQDRTLAVILLDVQGLHLINWRFGYAVGDRALEQVARILEARLCPEGMVARYGGDEFAVLLPDVGEIRATEVIEQLRGAIGQITIGAGGHGERDERFRLSVRVGLAVSLLDGMTADELLRKAETEWYRIDKPVSTIVSAGKISPRA